MTVSPRARNFAAAILLLAGAPPSFAQGARMASSHCRLQMGTVAAAVSSRGAADAASAAPIPLGSPVALTLAPIAAVRFPAPPHKAVGPYGGLFFFDVARAGTFRISLGARAWIDVAAGAATIASVAHAHGKPCSGVVKEVTFPLTAGPHAVEITASDAPTLALEIAPAP